MKLADRFRDPLVDIHDEVGKSVCPNFNNPNRLGEEDVSVTTKSVVKYWKVASFTIWAL